MNEEEPIEIKFVINSPEVLEQAMQVENSLKGVDSAVAKSEKNFDSYVQTQLEANKAMSEGVQLTTAQKRAFDTYTRTLEGLKAMMKDATDPTQIAMYKFKIDETTESLSRLVASTKTKAEIINTSKLEEAGRLLDSISDKTFSPDFASNKELELLAEKINGAKDEFEQLGVVLDFVQAKIGGISDKSTFDKINTEIQQANDLLGRTVQQYDTTGNSIAEMTDALKLFQEKLASETDEEKIKQLNANIEELENNIKRLSNIGKTGFDEFGNKIVEQTEQTKGLKGQLTELVQQMAKLRMEGKANTDQYAELSRQATKLRGSISLVNEEISQSSSTTSGLDTLIRATKGIASGYAIAKSASSLFGKDQKDVEMAILKVTSAMSLLQGLQVIQSELLRKEGLATKSLTYLKGLYTKAIGESTGAMKAFKVAMISLGIGALIVLLGELIANWDKVKKAIGLTNDELLRNQEIGKKANEMYGERIAKLQMLVATNEKVALTEEQKKKAVKDFNKEFGDTLGTAKDYADLEDRIIKNAPKYIEYLQLKAQAEASYMLSLEKQKNLLEQITALSTGDLKWYEQLEDWQNKTIGKAFGLLGVNMKEAEREITQSEILNIIGLPDEAQFKEAIKGYSLVIQKNLKQFRKEQEQDANLFKTSFDLQEQAGKLADSLNIKTKDKEAEAQAKKAFQDKIKALADISKAENEFEKQRASGLDKELKAIENRYNALRQKAKEAKLDAKDIGRIDDLERKEKATATYSNDTTELIKRLESEKELFKAYEELKTKIGAEEFSKRYETELKGFKDFKTLIESEIDKIEGLDNEQLPEQKTRIKALQELLKEAEKEDRQTEEQKYLKAFESSLTLQERIAVVEADYRNKRIELEKITNTLLRDEKLKLLEQEQKDAINSVLNQEFQIQESRRRLFDLAIGLTKKEFEVKIKSMEEYLNVSENLLDDNTKTALKFEIARGKELMNINNVSRDEKILLDRKKKLIAEINKEQKKGTNEVEAQARELEEINMALEEITKERMREFADKAYKVSDGMAEFAGSVREGNEELAEALDTIGDIANDIGNVVNNFSKGLVEGIVSLVATSVKWISNIGKSSDAHRREMERLRKQAYQNQLDYNKMLREQLVIEQSITDEYKTRADQIRNMQGVSEINAKSISEDMQKTFERMFMSWTKTVDKVRTSLAPGGIANFATVGELLGFRDDFEWGKFNGEIPELTDAIYEQLVQINKKNPFTGNAKEYFDQLTKLKEEYGSIEEAMRQLREEYINAVTGTTASALADSISKGLAEGKRSFEDFADDIEGFLRNAILSSLNAKFFGEQVRELQMALFDMMEDGSLSTSDVEKFQQMYMDIVKDAQAAMDMLNEAGIDLSGGSSGSNSLKGAIKGMTEKQADLLAGQMGGWRLAQLETNSILKSSFASTLYYLSKQVGLQIQIELNTRNISDTTQKILAEMKKKNIAFQPSNNYTALNANGL